MNYQEKYRHSKEAGYSDQEIINFLEENDPEFAQRMQQTQEAGYSPQEVLNFFNARNEPEEQEGAIKSAFRTAAQVPLGVAEGTPYGIGSSLFQLLALGESDLSVEEWQNLRREYEKSDQNFDEEAYERGRQEMLDIIPTVSNIARKVEKETGIPLEAKTDLQKGIRFASTASKLSPKGYTLRGMNTALPRPVLGAAIEGVREVLLKAGVPEPVADIASFAILKKPTEGAGKLDVGFKEKPSGMPERGFENLREKREVPAKKIEKINEKLNADFEKVSNKIINESPIGETAQSIKNDPTFKQASRELLNEAQTIANDTPGTLPTMKYKEALLKQAQVQIKGFALNEYKKNYLKYIKEAVDDVLPENMTYGELVEQYRENNRALGEYFEPGSSKALNRAKKDALLDQNRAIASVIEGSHPELSKIFKEGNARWTKIMDAEAVDNFVKEMFKEGRPNYKKMHDFFDKNGYDRLFKRALGEDGYKAFEQAMKDMLETEVPYNMMKVAKEKDVVDFFKKLIGFKISPKVGLAQVGWDVAKTAYRGLINALLDKPKLAMVFERAVKDAKAGNYKAAEEGFKTVQAEVQAAPSKQSTAASKPSKNETVDITPIKSQTNSFKTEKGSTYEINSDGSTTRNKAYRPEHGKQEQGIQPKSEKTYFISPENANKLSEFQAQGEGSKRIIELPDGQLGILYESGKNKGKVEARTIVNYEKTPKEGLIPVESWQQGRKVHFGNKIVEVNLKSAEKPTSSSSKQKQIDFAGPSAPLGLPEGKQPKLIEYKPKPLSEQTPKERAESIARKNFADLAEGKTISAPAKQELKKIRTSLLTTRGKGQQFHGTKNPIEELSYDIEGTSSPANIFGPGFYTTDALDIADGYAKAQRRTDKSTVYQVKEKFPQKIYDIEQPIDEFNKWWLDNMMSNYNHAKKSDVYSIKSFEDYRKNYSNSYVDYILQEYKPKSVRELYEKIREVGRHEGINIEEISDFFTDILNLLQDKGYRGISHKGGLLTKNPEHTVKIYWEPENLEIQEFSYPKEFKKIPKPGKNTK